MGMVAVPVDWLGWGFCFCLRPGCNHTWACWYIFFFLWICKIICIVFNRIVHIFDRSVRNSDPGMRIVLIHGLNSHFNSVLEMLKTGRDFQYRSNSHISLDPPFWLRRFVVSWKGVFATSHCLLKFTSISGHEILSNFDNTHKPCFLTEFTQSVFLVKAIQLVEHIAVKWFGRLWVLHHG